MSASVEFGSAREVWFATIADPSTKYSFLIRDDAYSKAAAVAGRTVRLGEPVTTGSNSAWSQDTWEGGNQQEVWRDHAMYKDASADTTTTAGRVKLWPGYKWPNLAYTEFLNPAFSGFAFANGPTGWGLDVPIFFGASDRSSRGGGGKLYKYDPATDSTTLLQTLTGSINAISSLNDQGQPGQWLGIGTSAGKFYIYHVPSNTLTLETTQDGIFWRGICPYGDATYYLSGKKLLKRTWTSPGPAVHSVVKEMTSYEGCAGLTVWNNRLWFGASRSDGRTDIFVTDGVTVTQAFSMPAEFHIMALAVHYGALYILGFRGRATTAGGITSEIYKYTGTSLTKLYEVGTGANGENNFIWDMVSFGRYLVWSRNGFTSTGKRPGVMYYDAEQDAIIDGPTWAQDPSAVEVHATGIHVWNNTLIVAFWDNTNYTSFPASNGPVGFAYVKVDGNVSNDIWGGYGSQGLGYNAATKEQYVLSSLYDGEIPGEQKVWLTGRIQCSVPVNSTIEVRLLFDDSTTESTVKTITNTDMGGLTKKTVVFPLKVAGAYQKSTTIRYKLYLRSTSGTANPDVNSATFDFVPAPAKRRTWRIRALCSDAQTRLDGSANSLTTAQAMEDELEQLWSSEAPVYFWEPRTSGTPADTSDAHEVMLSDFLSQSYRVVSSDTPVVREVSLTLTEVVQQ